MRQFAVIAELPKYMELPTDKYGNADIQKIFNSIVFNSEYFSGGSSSVPISQTNLVLGDNVFIETVKTAEGTTLIEVKFDFSVGTPIAADAWTSLTFDYDVLVYKDHDDDPDFSLTDNFYVNTYTLLSDNGKKVGIISSDIVRNPGRLTTDTAYDMDSNGITTDQNVARNSDFVKLGASNIDLQTANHKHVKTYYSNAYVSNSYVNAKIDGDTSGKSDYTYRLRFSATVTTEDTLHYAYMYDEMEQYIGDAVNSHSTLNTQWQGMLNYVDVSKLIADRAAKGDTVIPKVYYTTSAPATAPPADTPSDIKAYLEDTANGWILMTPDATNQIWTPASGDEVYAIMVEICDKNDDDNPEIAKLVANYGGTFSTDIYINMTAPAGSADNLRKLARNQYTIIFNIDQLSDTSKLSEVTSVLLRNNLQIQKVDYDNPKNGLNGAEFDIYTANGSVLSYATRNTTDSNEEFYETEDLNDVATNSNGILELALAANTYYILESSAPRFYDKNPTLYEISFSDTGVAALLNTYSECLSTDSPDLSFTVAGDTTYYKKDATDDTTYIDTRGGSNGIVTILNKMNLRGNATFTKVDGNTANSSSETEEVVWDDSVHSEGTVESVVSLADGSKQYINQVTVKDDSDSENVKAVITTTIRTVMPLTGAEYSLYEYVEGELAADPTSVVLYDGNYYYETDNTGTTVTAMTSNADGQIILKNIPLGTYVLREVVAPVGYQLSGDVVFNVSKDNIDIDNETFAIDLTAAGQYSGSDCDILHDSQITSSIRLAKTDSTSGAAIPKTNYVVYRVNDNADFGEKTEQNYLADLMKNWDPNNIDSQILSQVREGKTNESGVYRATGLSFGTYLVIESRAAAGYKINYGYTFDKDGKAQCVYEADSDDSSYITAGIIRINAESAEHNKDGGYFGLSHEDERKTGRARVRKYYVNAEESQESLAGGVFTLYKKAGAIPLTPTYQEVQDGSNTYTEYCVTIGTDSVYYTLNKDGSIKEQYTKDGSGNKTAYSGTFTPDKVIGEKTTGSDGWTSMFYELEWGTYYFKETTAPTGYQKSDEVYAFTVDRYTCDEINQAEVENEQKKGSVRLTKYGEDDTTTAITDTAVFELKKASTTDDADSSVYAAYDSTEKVYHAISASAYAELGAADKANYSKEYSKTDGKITVQNLEWGSYYFTEIKPPAGYANAADITFKINKFSCLTMQELTCIEPKATAYINLDKYIDSPLNIEDYYNAYGYPTFIFKITELDDSTETDLTAMPVKVGGNTYTCVMTFDADSYSGVPHMFDSIAVAAGCYKIEEISNPRFEFVSLETVAGTAYDTENTNLNFAYDSTAHTYGLSGSLTTANCVPASGTQTNGRVAYCNLKSDVQTYDDNGTTATVTHYPTYRVAYHNQIEEYDTLSHDGEVTNHISAADRYPTGLSAVYDKIIPVYADSDTYTLDKSDITAYILYNKGDDVQITGADLDNLIISGRIGETDISDSAGAETVTIPSGAADCSGQSYDVTVKYNYDGVEYEAPLTLNYSSLISDTVKYVTFRTDTNESVTFGDAKDYAATIYYVKNAKTGAITGPFNMDETPYNEKLTVEKGYVFSHWVYEQPDGTKLTSLETLTDLDFVKAFIFNDSYTPDGGDTFNGSKTYAENEPLTSFKFEAVVTENPLPKAKLAHGQQVRATINFLVSSKTKNDNWSYNVSTKNSNLNSGFVKRFVRSTESPQEAGKTIYIAPVSSDNTIKNQVFYNSGVDRDKIYTAISVSYPESQGTNSFPGERPRANDEDYPYAIYAWSDDSGTVYWYTEEPTNRILLNEDCSHMFDSCNAINDDFVNAGFSYMDASLVTDMSYMFSKNNGQIQQYVSLDLSGWNTSSVTTMHHMFYCQKNLQHVTWNGFKSDSLTDVSYMFNQTNIVDLDFMKDANMSKVQKMEHAFSAMNNSHDVTDQNGVNYSGKSLTSNANLVDVVESWSGLESIVASNSKNAFTNIAPINNKTLTLKNNKKYKFDQANGVYEVS